MIAKYFNTELNIPEVKYTGDIYLKDLMEFGNQIYQDSTLPRILLILTDVTKAQYRLSISEFPEMMDNMKKHVSVYKMIKAAFIQAQSKETAYSMHLETQYNIPKYHHAIFATREAALEWLLERTI